MALALPSGADEAKAYWQTVGGCQHGHHALVAQHRLSGLLLNHQPLTAWRMRRASHYRRCVFERAERRHVAAHWRRLWQWRWSYAHAWPIRFNRLPSWTRGWAVSTGACESGNDPTTNTGNGFYGAFQFLPGTWYAAGGDRFPTLASWHHQAVIAVNWMLRTSDEQWPVCGD